MKTFNREELESLVKSLINKHKTNFKGIGQPIRVGLTGSKFGPGIFDLILSLEKSDVIQRLKKII